MNRILFERSERTADARIVLRDVRARHVREVLRAAVGDEVRAGELNGQAGRAAVEALDADRVRLRLLDGWRDTPPPAFDLLLALPRPKALKRLWPQLAALGAGRIVLVNAARVERVYFDSHWLDEAHYRPLLIDGLMQAGTTVLPDVLVRRRFRPFVEDELDSLLPGRWRAVGQPGPATPVPPHPAGACGRPVLAVGPEGGWTDFELGVLAERGFRPLAIGERILRSDTACVALATLIAHAQATHTNPVNPVNPVLSSNGAGRRGAAGRIDRIDRIGG